MPTSPKNNFKKHPSILLHSDIAEICRAFFEQSDYCIMNFIRRYNDGTVVYLCDNRDWLEHYLNNNYPSLGAFEQNTVPIQHDYVLWNALSNTDPVVIDSRTLFNIRYGITLVCKFEDGCDYFNFGTSETESAIVGKIYNQLEQLQYFTKFFYEKTKRLLHIANQNRFDLEQFKNTENIITQNNRLYLGPTYEYAYLTEKEITCLKHLIAGKTIPDIATLLQVSPRTIEKHVENIKNKLHCNTQFELGYLAAKLGIQITE